jgi:hypothetical protein
MSLAELLKADLEDLEEQDEELDSQMNNDNMNDDEIEDVGMAEEMPEEEEIKLTFDQKTSEYYRTLNKDSVRHLAKLLDSEQLKRVTDQIEVYQKENDKRFEIVGPVEQDPEYKLIVEVFLILS